MLIGPASATVAFRFLELTAVKTAGAMNSVLPPLSHRSV
jgi:hypothetical protein